MGSKNASLGWTVDEWDGDMRGFRFAECWHFDVAEAAFHAAVAARPGRHIILTVGARVILDSKRAEDRDRAPTKGRGATTASA